MIKSLSISTQKIFLALCIALSFGTAIFLNGCEKKLDTAQEEDSQTEESENISNSIFFVKTDKEESILKAFPLQEDELNTENNLSTIDVKDNLTEENSAKNDLSELASNKDSKNSQKNENVNKVEKSKNVINLEKLLSKLLKGPSLENKRDGFGTEIPRGTRLLSVKENPESLTVDLSGQFVSGGGSRSMILRYKQLLQTIQSISADKPVYVLVEGKEIERIGGEGLVVENPIKPNGENQIL
jgi:spore germination protein GerM